MQTEDLNEGQLYGHMDFISCQHVKYIGANAKNSSFTFEVVGPMVPNMVTLAQGTKVVLNEQQVKLQIVKTDLPASRSKYFVNPHYHTLDREIQGRIGTVDQVIPGGAVLEVGDIPASAQDVYVRVLLVVDAYAHLRGQHVRVDKSYIATEA